MFCGTTILPLRKALPTAAFCTGSLRRFSVPVPMVLFLTKLGEVPFFTKVVDAPFLTKWGRRALLHKLVGIAGRLVDARLRGAGRRALHAS